MERRCCSGFRLLEAPESRRTSVCEICRYCENNIRPMQVAGWLPESQNTKRGKPSGRHGWRRRGWAEQRDRGRRARTTVWRERRMSDRNSRFGCQVPNEDDHRPASDFQFQFPFDRSIRQRCWITHRLETVTVL